MRTSSLRAFGVAAAMACMVVGSAEADVALHSMFGDNMVLQQGMRAPVWGTAEPGEAVSVTLDGQTANTEANAEKKWKVEVPAMKAGGPHELVVKGKNTITLKNVMIGEVWLASGQSNMAFAVRGMADAEAELAKADLPNLRLFTVKRNTGTKPLDTLQGSWQVCSPSSARAFSAVAYAFGSNLVRTQRIPVGLIDASWGGTPIQAWTSDKALRKLPELKPLFQAWENRIKKRPELMAAYMQKFTEWKEAAAKAKAANEKVPRRPRPPQGENSAKRPSNLFNAMIHPISPYAIRGAIWYQGEANRGGPASYGLLLSTMIRDWRSLWGQGDFYFLFVQLPDFRTPQEQPSQTDGWVRVREGQLSTLSVPNTGMAVTLGLGEAKNIHPKNKRPVGDRLALWARAKVYGEDIVYSGPLYKSMTVEDGKIRLNFDRVGGGLAAKDGELKGFAIAGEEKKFVWAKAEIDGDTVLVRNENIAEPVAVRYAWAANPVWSLINKEGLPASPFATDSPVE